MRCEPCGKFVSYDTETEPELNLSVDDEGHVTGDVHIVNTCAECGQELTEASLDVEIDVSGEVAEHRDAMKAAHDAEQLTKSSADPEYVVEPFNAAAHNMLTLDTEEGSRTDRRQTVDRNGKPIKSARYQKQFYGAHVEVTVACACGETFTGAEDVEVQASGMEQM